MDTLTANKLPVMTGTPKQVAWAEDIRMSAVNQFLAIADWFRTHEVTSEQQKDFDLACTVFEKVKNETSAKFWIDNRFKTARELIREAKNNRG